MCVCVCFASSACFASSGPARSAPPPHASQSAWAGASHRQHLRGYPGRPAQQDNDPALNAWEAVAPMAAARATVGVVVLDGKLYAVGGYGGGQHSSVERYDPALDAWEAVAPMATARSFAVAFLM